jgi:hypothetical protein
MSIKINLLYEFWTLNLLSIFFFVETHTRPGGEMIYVGTTCLRAAGSSPAPPAVSDMAYRVVRQGFDPGLRVFLCQQ